MERRTSEQIEHALGLQMTFTRNALLVRDDATIESIFRENNRFRDTFDRLEAAAPTDQRETIQRLRSRRGMFGNILQPDECWMLDSRLPTVSLRMNRQSKNAQRIAEAPPATTLSRVIYPTLFTDPEQIRIYKKQCAYPGGIFSLDFKGGKPAAFDFLRRLNIARNAVSLGGVGRWSAIPRAPRTRA
jgi:cystathionine beta-lyase/cystathionine gamma-synthase